MYFCCIDYIGWHSSIRNPKGNTVIEHFTLNINQFFVHEIQQSETLKNMTAAHISSMVTVCRGGDGILHY